MTRQCARRLSAIGLSAAFFVTCPAHAESVSDRLFAAASGESDTLKALAPSDRQAIAALLPLALGDGGTIVDTFCRQDAHPEVAVADPDRNGRTIVFVMAGNACASGATGASLYVLLKTGSQWAMVLDVAAAGYKVLPTRAGGYPELGIGGRGRCLGVWRFDGRVYTHSRNVDERGMPCRP